MRSLLKKLWHGYVRLARRWPLLAIPSPKKPPGFSRTWVHPAYARHNWLDTSDDLYATVKSLAVPKGVFFDVGANIGQTALEARRVVGPQGKVVAFEPSEENIKILRYHLRWNGMSDVRIVPTCVGAFNGEVTFSLLADGLHSSHSITFSQKKPQEMVPTERRDVTTPLVALDSWCSKEGIYPDVIKIDVEGAEYDVLCGARQILQSKKPTLIIGIHPFWWPDQQAPDTIDTLLAECGYAVTDLHGQPAQANAYADYICRPIKDL